MAVTLFRATFDGTTGNPDVASTTPEVGGAWNNPGNANVTAGSLIVDSATGKATDNDTKADNCRTTGDLLTDDYTITATGVNSSTRQGCWVGIGFRGTDSTFSGGLVFAYDQTQYILTPTSGAYLATFTDAAPPANGTWEVTVAGNTVTCKVNGVTKITYTSVGNIGTGRWCALQVINWTFYYTPAATKLSNVDTFEITAANQPARLASGGASGSAATASQTNAGTMASGTASTSDAQGQATNPATHEARGASTADAVGAVGVGGQMSAGAASTADATASTTLSGQIASGEASTADVAASQTNAGTASAAGASTADVQGQASVSAQLVGGSASTTDLAASQTNAGALAAGAAFTIDATGVVITPASSPVTAIRVFAAPVSRATRITALPLARVARVTATPLSRATRITALPI